MRLPLALTLTAFTLGLLAEEKPLIEINSEKRVKPHFAGVKRSYEVASKEKKSSRIPIELKVDPADPSYFPKGPNYKGNQTIADASEEPKAAPKQPATSPDDQFKGPKSDVFITADWIFWRARQEGLDYAVTRNGALAGELAGAAGQAVVPKWASGFKLGFGVHLPQDRWDIYLNYTMITPRNTATVTGTIVPLLLYQGQFSTENVATASGDWRVQFMALDLELGRATAITRRLTVRPHIGLKGGWINQRFNVSYSGGDIPANTVFSVNQRNKFKGGGLRAGVDSNWDLGYGINIYGNVSASVLAGNFNTQQEQAQNGGLLVIDLNSWLNLMTPVAQAALGLGWDRNFKEGKYHFGMSLGFEMQYWWQQDQLERFTSTVPTYTRIQGDLGFYGITLDFRFDF